MNGRVGVAALLIAASALGCASPATPSPTPLPASPDGTVVAPPDGRIAFTRATFDVAANAPTGGDLWSIRTDGSDLLRLTDLPGFELFPTWSPDGSRLAFVRGDGRSTGDVWVIDADADPTAADRHLTKLTDEAGMESAPDWSPDGRWIAYVADWQGRPSVWIRPADGTGEASG